MVGSRPGQRTSGDGAALGTIDTVSGDGEIDEARIWGRMAGVRLFVALGRNRADFEWDALGNRPLLLRHLSWCLEQEESGWLVGAGPLDETGIADGLAIFAAESNAELRRVLDTDPLVLAGVRRYAVVAWLLNQGVARTLAEGGP